MFASPTQETLLRDENSSSPHGMFLRSISALDAHDFQTFVQDTYGACWGTLKFEDSLSDYTNNVMMFKDSSKDLIEKFLLGSTVSLR